MKTNKQESEEDLTTAVQTYKPTRTQLLWLEKALDPEVQPTITAIAKAVGVKRANWYLWQEKEGFQEWWAGAWEEAMNKNKWWLDKVGLRKSIDDYRYWEAMQMKYAQFMRREGHDFTSKGEKIGFDSLFSKARTE